MLDSLKSMLASRKAIAAVSGSIIAIAAKKGLDLPPDLVYSIVGLFMAYILGTAIEGPKPVEPEAK